MKSSTVYQLIEPYKLIKEETKLDVKHLPDNAIFAYTEYTVISKGTELAAWRGAPPLRAGSTYPRLMGYCNLARVEKVGQSVFDILPGDYILTNQSHRSSFICSYNEVLFSIRNPEEDIKKKISATYLYYLIYSSLLSTNFKPGYTVAVLGLGVLGFMTASLLEIFGSIPVIFTDQLENPKISNHPKFQFVFPKKYEKNNEHLPELFQGGIDLLINTSNRWQDHLLALQLAKKNGEIIYLGFPGRCESSIPFNPLEAQYFYGKGLNIKHCGYPKGLSIHDSEDFLSAKSRIKYLVHLIQQNKLDPSEIFSLNAKSDDLALTYQSLNVNKPGLLTALIQWDK